MSKNTTSKDAQKEFKKVISLYIRNLQIKLQKNTPQYNAYKTMIELVNGS